MNNIILWIIPGIVIFLLYNYIKKNINNLLNNEINIAKEKNQKVIEEGMSIKEEVKEHKKEIVHLENIYQIVKNIDRVVDFDELIKTLHSQGSKIFIYSDFLLTLFEENEWEYYNLRTGEKIEAKDCKTRQAAYDWIIEKKKSYFKIEEFKDSRFENIDVERSILNTIVSPLLFKQNLYGCVEIVNYGLKDSESNVFNVYTESDIEKFELIAQSIAIAVDRIKLYDRMRELSIQDTLTGLYNHRYFIERIEQEVNFSLNSKSHLSIIMADIDHFKKFNDTYGHLAGDYVLKEVSSVLQDGVRNIDFVARYGGEEFIIYLPETDYEGAYITAERIRRDVEKKEMMFDGKKISVTISMGTATLPHDGKNSTDFIEAADKRLYKSKNEGRNKVTGPKNTYEK